jgi:quinol monooxygenase YgiN
MVIVMGTAKFAPGELDRIASDMTAQIAATRAEDGCESYVFARDVLDPDTLQISERWRDSAAIDAHFKSAHMAAFSAVMNGAQVLSISVKSYDGDTVRTLIGE